MTSLGCFCYLINHTPAALADFDRSLQLLKRNYLDQYPTTVIGFHEAELTEAAKQHILESGVPVQFEPISFEVPDFIDQSRPPGGRVGYIHMCRFFANFIFQHPALQPFTYYCRLDTDSFIMSPVKKNLFKWADARNVYYGFIDDSITDQPQFTVNLWPTAQQFVDSHPEYPTFGKLYQDIPEGRVYYTNFELCRCSWFRQVPWLPFFAHLDRAGGIYYHRWGDHTIRYMGVKLFMPPERIARVTDIHYRHTFEYNQPRI